MTYQVSDFKVGDEVVLMTSYGIPCRSNSVNNPVHPCRTTITKVGKTRVYGHLTGKDAPYALALNPSQSGLLAVPLADAKRMYGEALAARNHPRREELVNGL